MNELCKIFPQSKDILVFTEKYNLLKSVNSGLIIDYFIIYKVKKITHANCHKK